MEKLQEEIEKQEQLIEDLSVSERNKLGQYHLGYLDGLRKAQELLTN